jgi:hypothetical protein
MKPIEGICYDAKGRRKVQLSNKDFTLARNRAMAWV